MPEMTGLQLLGDIAAAISLQGLVGMPGRRPDIVIRFGPDAAMSYSA